MNIFSSDAVVNEINYKSDQYLKSAVPILLLYECHKGIL